MTATSPGGPQPEAATQVPARPHAPASRAHRAQQLLAGAKPTRRSEPAATAHPGEPGVDEVTFPIDLVYTWVDGNDPDWAAWKDASRRRADRDGHTADADDPSRYTNHDELRYSLRSVAMFADFVRHVFVVTDGQVPPWLNTDHERLTLVDHRAIFPDPSWLPTFNSHAIECRLHRIEGLAEHYLYLNDDFLFGRPVRPEQFFHANGLTKFFLSPAPIAGGDPRELARSVDAAAANAKRVISQRFGRAVSQKVKHAPYPQRRSVLYEMEDALCDEFERTSANPFRGPADVPVPSSLYHYYAYLTGRAVPGNIKSRYVGLGERGLGRRLRRLRRDANFDVVCLNDSGDARTARRARRRRAALTRFMESYWPTQSPFER